MMQSIKNNCHFGESKMKVPLRPQRNILKDANV